MERFRQRNRSVDRKLGSKRGKPCNLLRLSGFFKPIGAHKTNYGLQGWMRGRIYPDFIFATSNAAGAGRIVVLETKGDHLQNPDTDYKAEVLKFLTESFSWDHTVPAGQLQIAMTGETVECALVLMDDIPTKLPVLISGA